MVLQRSRCWAPMLVLLLAVLMMATGAAAPAPSSRRPPIFIIPGLMASSLRVRFNPLSPVVPPGGFLQESAYDALLMSGRTTPAGRVGAGAAAAVPKGSTPGRSPSPARPGIAAEVFEALAAIRALDEDGSAVETDSTGDRGSTTTATRAMSVAAADSIDGGNVADGTAAAQHCPGGAAVADLRLWPPSSALAARAPHCWLQLVRLHSSLQTVGGRSSTRFSNASGASVWAESPGASGMRYPLFQLAGYERLVFFLEVNFGYKPGQDIFVLPYDFRLDPGSLQASGQMAKLASEVTRHVLRAGGRRAILIGHSLGAGVALQMLRHDAALRSRVAGFVALAPPFGGSAAALPARLNGAFDYLLPWLAEELQALLARDAAGDSAAARGVRNALALMAVGSPSAVTMLPYAEAFGANTVVISTNTTCYTVSQLPRLLREIGEHSLAGAYDQVHALSGLLAAGPLPGVRTFCIYGAGADTPRSWVYTAPLGPPARGMAAAELPRVDAVGKGDGVVGLESLRLCGRLTSSPADVFELEGVSHTSVYTRRVAFKAIKRALEALGVTGG